MPRGESFYKYQRAVNLAISYALDELEPQFKRIKEPGESCPDKQGIEDLIDLLMAETPSFEPSTISKVARKMLSSLEIYDRFSAFLRELSHCEPHARQHPGFKALEMLKYKIHNNVDISALSEQLEKFGELDSYSQHKDFVDLDRFLNDLAKANSYYGFVQEEWIRAPFPERIATIIAKSEYSINPKSLTKYLKEDLRDDAQAVIEQASALIDQTYYQEDKTLVKALMRLILTNEKLFKGGYPDMRFMTSGVMQALSKNKELDAIGDINIDSHLDKIFSAPKEKVMSTFRVLKGALTSDGAQLLESAIAAYESYCERKPDSLVDQGFQATEFGENVARTD